MRCWDSRTVRAGSDDVAGSSLSYRAATEAGLGKAEPARYHPGVTTGQQAGRGRRFMEHKVGDRLQRGDTRLSELVRAVALGDQHALERLYDLTVARVYHLAYALMRDTADAEEIVCDVYLQVWQRAADYDATRGSVIAWLLVRCRSLALDRLRQRRAREGALIILAEQPALREENETTEHLLHLLDNRSAIHRALRELPRMQCWLIALAFFKGLSHVEIARAVQLPLGTVKSHLRRGLRALRTAIES